MGVSNKWKRKYILDLLQSDIFNLEILKEFMNQKTLLQALYIKRAKVVKLELLHSNVMIAPASSIYNTWWMQGSEHD